jgi:hypothetical protein
MFPMIFLLQDRSNASVPLSVPSSRAAWRKRHIALGEKVDIAVVQRKIDALETELAAPRVKMRGHIRELGTYV